MSLSELLTNRQCERRGRLCHCAGGVGSGGQAGSEGVEDGRAVPEQERSRPRGRLPVPHFAVRAIDSLPAEAMQ